MELADKRVLVTGANGFIGSHLVARLARDEGTRVRALVRSASGLLTGLDVHPSIEEMQGDVTDRDSMIRAVEGCKAVIHAAACQPFSPLPPRSRFLAVNVGGTENLLHAFIPRGESRFILLSTVNVHGLPPPPHVDAESPLVRSGDFYSDSKVDGETVAWNIARHRDIPLAVVRPACTFGPNGRAWTLRPLEQIRRGWPVLVGGGHGICNPMYIDNLVDLIIASLKNDSAIGQSFIGSQGTGVEWRDFYGNYARMLGLTAKAMPVLAARLAAIASFAYERLTGRPGPLSPSSLAFYSHRVTFEVDKNARLLGYYPRFTFEQGMQRTEAWLRENKMI